MTQLVVGMQGKHILGSLPYVESVDCSGQVCHFKLSCLKHMCVEQGVQ